MRGWIILFTLLTLTFFVPFPLAANQSQWIGANVCGVTVFGSLAALFGATLLGRAKA